MSTFKILIKRLITYILAAINLGNRHTVQNNPENNIWDPQMLEQKRQSTDPTADDVIAQMMQSNQVLEAKTIFHQLICNSSPLPTGLPDDIAHYFQQTRALPSWADHKKMQQAQQIFGSYGPEIVLILFCKSLPLAYACWRGARVLTSTGRMTAQSTTDFTRLNRRIMETAQFVMNVMAPHSFGASGDAIETIQKVRLIHAAIRYYLKESGTWDSTLCGEPINQQDMAGTLMSFSICIIQGLEQLGIELSEQEKEAYLHHWNVIGAMMGLEPSLLPENVAAAESLMSTILQQQAGPSDDGQLLTQSLLDYLASLIEIDVFDDYPHFMVQFFCGDAIASDLNVKIQHKPLWVVLTGFLHLINEHYDKIEESSALLRRLSGKVSRKLLQSLINQHNDYKKIDFFIPPSLQENWKIN